MHAFRLSNLLASALLAAAPLAAQAQVSFGTSNGFVTINLSAPITFTSTRDSQGSAVRFVFEDAYSAPVTDENLYYGTQSNTIGVLLNGSAKALDTSNIWGPLWIPVGTVLDPDDFSITFSGSNGIAAGTVVTLTAGTAVTNVPASLLPDRAPFQITMATNTGLVMAAPLALASAVPEPASAGLLLAGLAAAGTLAVRRQA